MHLHNMATIFNNHPYISSSGTFLVCVLCQPVHSCIEPSLHGLDFFLEIFLWRLLYSPNGPMHNDQLSHRTTHRYTRERFISAKFHYKLEHLGQSYNFVSTSSASQCMQFLPKSPSAQMTHHVFSSCH